jgi:hypothetical protein
MRSKIISRFFEFAMGSICPEKWTVYPDEGTPVRCLIAGKQHRIVEIKGRALRCRPVSEDWPESDCKHEWTAIGHREANGIKFRIWYCDNCASIGPRKVQTFEEVSKRCNFFPLEAMREAGMTKKGPLVSKV